MTASTTEIGRASHVLVIRVQSVSFGDWATQGRTKVREVELGVRVDEVLEGPMAVGAAGTITVTQHAPATSRAVGVPGVWSPVELALGTSWLVLSHSTSTALGEALEAPQSVLPVQPARNEALLAHGIEAKGLPLEAACEALRNAPEIATAGPLLVGYLGERLDAFTPRDPASASALTACLRMLEAPNIAPSLQMHGMSRLLDRLLLFDAAPPLRAQAALCGLRLIASAPASPVAQALGRPLLPNLLGLEGAASPVGPQAVFQADPTARREIAAVLENSRDPAFAALAAWIR